MASQDWFEKDFYAILGVAQDADDATIKKTYRKLARKLHPDQNPGDSGAEKRFKEVGEAYAVLSDPEQRREYDAVRQMARGGARFTAGGGPGAGAGGFEDIFSAFGGGGGNVRFSNGGTGFRGAGGPGGPGGAGQSDLNDILSQMFGGAAGGGAHGGGGDPFSGYGAPRGPVKGRDIQARTSLSFRDATQGSTVTLQGADGKSMTVKVPAGVKDGQKIRLRGKGEPGDAGPGDLILTVSVGKHPVFARDGDNLTLDLPVTFAEAALGATVAVPTMDGKSVKVKVAPGTPSGRVLRLKGRGITTKDGAGDLLAKVSIVVPTELTDEARAAVETLAAHDGADPRATLFEQAGQ